MKVVKHIKFKELREKGANALEIKDDEVIQMSSKNGMLCIVTQEYLLKLLDIKNEQNFHWAPSQNVSNQVMGFCSNNEKLELKGSAQLFANNNLLNPEKKLSSNIKSLLNSQAPKNLEDRVSDLEETLKNLLNNKEENNGR